MKILITFLFLSVSIFAFSQTKISALPPGTTPTGSELIPGVQGGVTVQFTLNQIRGVPPTFYVNDYGAVGDSNGTAGNGTDNTTAFANCLSAIQAAGGGIMIIGKGIYRYKTTGLDFSSDNIKVQGLGMGTSTLFWDDISSSNRPFRFRGSNCTVEHLSIIERNTFQSSHVALILSGTNCRASNVEVYNYNCFGIYVIGENSFVDKCYVHDGKADGIHISGGATNFKVTNNRIYNCQDDGIGVGYDNTTMYGIISGNSIEQVSGGINIWGYSTTPGTALVKHIVVSNNNIFNTFVAGIGLLTRQGSIDNIDIIGNVIVNAGLWVPSGTSMRGSGFGGGIVVDTDCSTSASESVTNILISGNNIYNPINNFVNIGKVTNRNGFIAQIGNIKVVGNVFSSLTNVGGITGGGSSTSDPGQYGGVEVQNATPLVNTKIDISDNSFKVIFREAVRVESTSTGYFNISDNKLIGGNYANTAGLYAYSFLPTSATVYMSGNTTMNPVNAFTGDYIIGAGATIVGGQIIGNTYVGSANGSATAKLHLAGGSTSSGSAPLKLTAGTNMTTPETGAMEYDGISLFFTPQGTTRRTIATSALSRLTGQTAAINNLVQVTNGSFDKTFEIGVDILITSSTTHSFTATVAYTDEGNTSRTTTLNFSQTNGTIGTTISNTAGAVPYSSIPIQIRCKASTTITIATTGTFTSVTYSIGGRITQLN